MTLRPATLVRALTTGYPLSVPSTTAADGLPAHVITETVTVDSVEHFGRLWQTGNGRHAVTTIPEQCPATTPFGDADRQRRA